MIHVYKRKVMAYTSHFKVRLAIEALRKSLLVAEDECRPRKLVLKKQLSSSVTEDASFEEVVCFGVCRTRQIVFTAIFPGLLNRRHIFPSRVAEFGLFETIRFRVRTCKWLWCHLRVLFVHIFSNSLVCTYILNMNKVKTIWPGYSVVRAAFFYDEQTGP